MAKDPFRLHARSNSAPGDDSVLRVGTGDYHALEGDDGVPRLPSTKILKEDAQRAVPTDVYSKRGSSEESARPRRREVTEPDPAFLHIDRGPGAGRDVVLHEGELSIGRSSARGLKIAHPSVSREHAIVVRRGDRFFVRDAGSHNGTYVNGRQISGQTELFPDDEIALGKAVLILRAGSRSGRHRTATNVALAERSSFKLLVFAAAVGLGIVAVFVLARFRPGLPEEPRPQPVAVAPAAPKPTPPPEPAAPKAAEPAEVKIEPPPPEPPKPEAKAEVAKKDDLNLAAPEVSAAKVFHESKSRGDTRLEIPNKISEPRKSKSSKAKSGRSASADSSSTAEAMALYESGDLEGAVAAARAAGNNALADKIALFKKELTTAKTDLSFKDGAGAIKHYTAALAIDDELSKGWGKLGGQIRVELAKLFALAAEKALNGGDASKAAGLAKKALKYDPDNEKAKEVQARAQATAAKPAATRSAADKAFDQ